jgi:hypothetical protein
MDRVLRQATATGKSCAKTGRAKSGRLYFAGTTVDRNGLKMKTILNLL